MYLVSRRKHLFSEPWHCDCLASTVKWKWMLFGHRWVYTAEIALYFNPEQKALVSHIVPCFINGMLLYKVHRHESTRMDTDWDKLFCAINLYTKTYLNCYAIVTKCFLITKCNWAYISLIHFFTYMYGKYSCQVRKICLSRERWFISKQILYLLHIVYNLKKKKYEHIQRVSTCWSKK